MDGTLTHRTADAAEDAWTRLDAELARWPAGSAVLWWRDDDAVTATPALDHLLQLAGGTPITLAVVPKRAEAALGRRLDQADARRVTIVQHGWSHRDHGDRHKAELGPERPAATVLAELEAGREMLQALYGDRFVAVLVPPWNRIDPALIPKLAPHYRGLSVDKTRPDTPTAPGLAQAPAQIDLIDWNDGARFVGEEVVLDAITTHLAAQREGHADQAEPTGILTHHLVQDQPTSRFLEQLLPFLAARPAARWAMTTEIFGLS